MHITRDTQHDLRILQTKLLHDSSLGLAEVEGVAVRRGSMHVMNSSSLLRTSPSADLRANDSRHVHAAALIDRHGLRRNRRGGKRSLQAEEDVGEASVGAGGDDLLNRTFSGIELRATGIHPHPDDLIAGTFPFTAMCPAIVPPFATAATLGTAEAELSMCPPGSCFQAAASFGGYQYC